jgi:uncharacterized membrane protein YhaH (DUF805 family)
MNFETLFVNPLGRTARGPYIGALIPLLAAAAFYYFLVKGVNGQDCLVVLAFPAVVLHARRLHDMGKTAWLLLAPVALAVAALWLHLTRPGDPLETPVTLAAIVVSAGFVLWGLVGKGRG